MLDWLKPILGDSYTEDSDQKIQSRLELCMLSKIVEQQAALYRREAGFW